jgi:hypothetical protein
VFGSFTEKLLGKKMVCLRAWMKKRNGSINLLASTTFVAVCMKFGGDFTFKGRFDSGKTRAHYIVVPLLNPTDWSRYNRVLQSSNVAMPEVVMENGYRLEHNEDGPYNEGVGYNEQEAGVEGEGTQGDMDLDGNLTQEHFDYAKVGRIRDDFDVREFEWEEEEWEVEDRMGDDVSSDSDDSGDDNGGTDARATLVVPMPTPVPTEVLHAMPTQGRLVHDLPEEDTPYDSWGRISEAQQYVLPPPYTAAELMQMREANLPFSVVPNYRDVSMV